MKRAGAGSRPTASGRDRDAVASLAQPRATYITRADGVRRVVVVGLGFAGLPTAVAIGDAGLETIGLDIDQDKVGRINAGESVSGVSKSALGQLLGRGLLRATTDESVINEADVVVVSVPTPVDHEGTPDERMLAAACQTVVRLMRREALVVLQSTVVPGATRRYLVEPLASLGLIIGRDVFVAYSPERINPGDPYFRVSNTTKLVAGATDYCRTRGLEFVESFVDTVRPVSTLEAAELAKLVENTFRFVNISFVNEVAVLCSRLGVSAWDVIEAAASKPFAFMPHHPGPGIGGDCIPVSPRYLQASALQHGLVSEIIPAAFRATDAMPDHVVDRCAAELGADPRDLSGFRVLVVGVAYKADVADTRHSPAVAVIRTLRQRGAEVAVLDPLVGEIDVDEFRFTSIELDGEWPNGVVGAHAAILVTPHSSIDYELLGSLVDLIIDTRNALRTHTHIEARVVHI